jgi:hypothetical protein
MKSAQRALMRSFVRMAMIIIVRMIMMMVMLDITAAILTHGISLLKKYTFMVKAKSVKKKE